jgi:hypothetical protein
MFMMCLCTRFHVLAFTGLLVIVTIKQKTYVAAMFLLYILRQHYLNKSLIFFVIYYSVSFQYLQCHNVLAKIRHSASDTSRRDMAQSNKHCEVKSAVLEKLKGKVQRLWLKLCGFVQ